jgi:hypothetical protein
VGASGTSNVTSTTESVVAIGVVVDLSAIEGGGVLSNRGTGASSLSSASAAR